jgi:GNAT superfamily N-acetyltransferase
VLVSEELSEDHDLSLFDCGEPTFNDWLKSSARTSDGRRITRTYVLRDDATNVVVGYYATMPFLIERETLDSKAARGLPTSIPCFLIAKLALDQTQQGQRTGTLLLASALERLARAAASTGGRFIVVDAFSEDAAAFYQHHGFTPIKGRPDRLTLLVRSVARRIEAL